jgi:hypothetical protein
MLVFSTAFESLTDIGNEVFEIISKFAIRITVEKTKMQEIHISKVQISKEMIALRIPVKFQLERPSNEDFTSI